jgi:FlaA1/EpsC-like NDP-sugar epimerase
VRDRDKHIYKMVDRLEVLAFSILGKRFMPIWVILLLDLTMVGLSFFFAWLLLTDFHVEGLVEAVRLQGLALLLISYGLSFVLYRSYEGAFRHTGVRDLLRLSLASVSATVTAYLISRSVTMFLPHAERYLPVAFLILHGFTFIMGVLGLRLFVKLAYSRFILKTTGRKEVGALIYGAGVTGITVRNAIRQDPKSNTEVVGFIDDNPALVGKRIDGVKIFSFEEVFNERFLRRHNIHRVVWSIQADLDTSFHKVGDACLSFSLQFQRVPKIDDWIDGSLSTNQLRRVRIEDLLNRTPIRLNNENIMSFLRGKRVLVTGAAGSIGSEIARQVLHYNPECLIVVDNGETAMYELLSDIERKLGRRDDLISYIGDVTRQNRMEEIFARTKPEVVFHAAAYKHVPLMEENAKEAVRVNIMGTKIVSEAAIRHGVKKFVMVSTDKAVNPSNVMGASKRSAEILVQGLQKESQTEFITTRFGNVLGSNGSVIPVFRRQIENRENLTITHRDIVRYFMTIPEAVQLVLEAGTMGRGGEIFVFDMGEPVRIYDLAEKMIKLSGLTLDKDIRIVETGLRPGEKLYEELLGDTENTVPTHNPKIMIAKVAEGDWVAQGDCLEGLVLGCLNGASDEDLVRLLKNLVPEYRSLNSGYSRLD